MTLAVRQLGRADVAAYRALRLEALGNEPTSFGSDLPRETAFADEQWLERLTVAITFGVFDGETLVGIATLARHSGIKERHRADIYGVYLRKAHRGGGAGGQMLRGLIAAAPQGIVQVHLTVTASNAVAVRFYEKLGFERYGTEPQSLYVEGRFYDEHLMVLRLDEGGRKVNNDE